jgi:hypothetical protein
MMSWQIERNLKKIGRRAAPDQETALAIRRTLERAGYLPTRGLAFLPALRTAAASLGILLTFGSGTAVYAYNSDNVLPDHPLYAVRQQIEDVEESLAPSPERREQVRLKRLQRRMREIRLLRLKEKPVPPRITERVIQRLNDLPPAVVPSALPQEDELNEDIKIERMEVKELLKDLHEAKSDEERKQLDPLLIERAERLEQNLHRLEERTKLKRLYRRLLEKQRERREEMRDMREERRDGERRDVED